MRTIFLVCAFLVSYVLEAQDVKIIGGELVPAMVVDGNVKVTKLVGCDGSRCPDKPAMTMTGRM